MLKCNRCKIEIPTWEIHFIGDYDLCDLCYKKLEEWIFGKENEK